MKKNCLLILGIFIMFVVVVNLNIRANSPSMNDNKLFLLNIEALRLNESATSNCSGLGTLDCPHTNLYKVKQVW